MCIIFIAWQVHPEYPFILIANRDEFFARETMVAAPWVDASYVFGGRDGERGGTWLGINEEGRIAAVTNYRNGNLRLGMISPESRGLLTADWLKGNTDTTKECCPEEYLKSINGNRYDGYNLIVGTVQNGLWYTSNFVENGAVHKVTRGIHGVSNHYMDAPGWPKVEIGKAQLKSLLNETTLDENDLVERLFGILRNDAMQEKDALPRTGIDKDMERLLSSVFVKAEEYDYGTRASTVILASKNGEVRFIERTFGRDHKMEHQSEHCFKLASDHDN